MGQERIVYEFPTRNSMSLQLVAVDGAPGGPPGRTCYVLRRSTLLGAVMNDAILSDREATDLCANLAADLERI